MNMQVVYKNFIESYR